MDLAPLIDRQSQIDLRESSVVGYEVVTESERNKSEYRRPDTFLQALQYDAPEVVHFLLSLGILSPWDVKSSIETNIGFFLYGFSYFIARISPLYFFFASIAYFAIIHESLGVYIEFGVLIDTLLFVQVIVLLPFLSYVIRDLHNQRSSDRLLHIEVAAYKSLMKTCYTFSGVFFAMIVLDFILKYRLSIENWMRVNLLEFVSIGFITTAVLFISADCRVCLTVLENLCKKASEDTLTLADLKQTRQDIDDRVNRHANTISWIIFIAVCNILYLFIFDIIISKWTTKSLLELLPWKLASYAKEIAFLLVLFNESAKLNERADQLAEIVSNDVDWSIDENDDIESIQRSNEKLRHQVNRLMLFSALSTKPISYPIAGRRWTKTDMILQILTIIVTTLIVVIRAILIGHSW